MAGQCWAGRHLYCPCLEVPIDPSWNVRTLRSLLELFCPSSQRDTESIAFFSLALITLSLLVGLLRTGGQAWIGAHTGFSLQDNNTLEQSVIDISPWKPLCSWGKHTNMWHCLSFASTVHLRNLSLWAQVKKEKEGSYIEGIGARRTPWKG